MAGKEKQEVFPFLRLTSDLLPVVLHLAESFNINAGAESWVNMHLAAAVRPPCATCPGQANTRDCEIPASVAAANALGVREEVVTAFSITAPLWSGSSNPGLFSCRRLRRHKSFECLRN